MNKQTLQVVLTEDLAQRVIEMATHLGCSRSFIMKRAIENFVDSEWAQDGLRFQLRGAKPRKFVERDLMKEEENDE